MQSFFNNSKKISLVILNVLIIAGSAFFICQSDKFQQKISPKKYWENKIKILESELKKDEVKLKSLKLDIEKENALSPFHEEQAKIKAEEINESFDDSFVKVENEYATKINEIKHEIEEISKQEQEIKSNLELAYNQIKDFN